MSMDPLTLYNPITPSQQWCHDMLRNTVDEAGGQMLGIQMHLLSDETAELWFKNPQNGANLHIVFNPYNFEAEDIRAQVTASLQADTDRHLTRKTGVPVEALKSLSDKLLKLSEEIKALYEEKK